MDLPLPRRRPSWPFACDRGSEQARDLLLWWPMYGGGGKVLDMSPWSLRHGSWTSTASYGYDRLYGRSANTTSGTSDLQYAGFTWPTNFSFALWVCRNDSAAAPLGCFGKRAAWNSSNGAAIWFGYNDSTDVSFSVNTAQATSATSLISDGTTYHIVGTYDGANIVLYLNGSQVATAALTGTVTDNAENLKTGPFQVRTYKFWDVRVYARALSARNVADMYSPVKRWELYRQDALTVGKAPVAPGGLSIPIAAYHYNHHLGSMQS